jgi:4-amino-4-deoxy-L-arabinose transferase-like glycosyltransferase
MSHTLQKPLAPKPNSHEFPIWVSSYPVIEIDSMTRRLRIVCVGVIALGFVLRLVDLNLYGLNTDEVVYVSQAAGILGNTELEPYFPIFRAHPMLFQFILALVYSITGVSDFVGRLVSATFGALTVLVTFALGKTVFGSRVGILSALFIASMPYHVIVTRQVLLDGPMTFFSTVSLLCLALYARDRMPHWLYGASIFFGLTFLTKETGLIMIGAFYLFFALCPSVLIRWRDVIISLAIVFVFISIFPLTLSLAGAGNTGQSYLIWQLLRRPNHPWYFYAITALPMIGVLPAFIAVFGAAARWRIRTWRETLLIVWILVPIVFFQFWQVKGFQYLLPIVPAVSTLSAYTLLNFKPHHTRLRTIRFSSRSIRAFAIIMVVASLAISCWLVIRSAPQITVLAGQGGLPGGRETGWWFRRNTISGTQIMAVGPAIANPIQFYGLRKTHMLSISQNPTQRNPAYEPMENPDLSLRNGEIHYIVWDAYSAVRSKFFTDKLMSYVHRYNGKVVHTEIINNSPVVVVYEVRP